MPGREPHAGFRCRTTIDDSPEALRQTRLAVARAKEGDEEAFRFLYLRFSHNIYGYVRSIVRDDHDAEDVTQHVFAKLMTSLVKYDDRGIHSSRGYCGWRATSPSTTCAAVAARRVRKFSIRTTQARRTWTGG